MVEGTASVIGPGEPDKSLSTGFSLKCINPRDAQDQLGEKQLGDRQLEER